MPPKKPGYVDKMFSTEDMLDLLAEGALRRIPGETMPNGDPVYELTPEAYARIAKVIEMERRQRN